MIRRLGYDAPLPPKAWVQVPPTESVPGTEDDETFYLPLEAKKERARQYVTEHRDHIKRTARAWYLRNKERCRAKNAERQKSRFRGK